MIFATRQFAWEHAPELDAMEVKIDSFKSQLISLPIHRIFNPFIPDIVSLPQSP